MDIALLGAVLAACVLCLLEKKKAQIVMPPGISQSRPACQRAGFVVFFILFEGICGPFPGRSAPRCPDLAEVFMVELLLILAAAAAAAAALAGLGYLLVWFLLHGRRDGPGWEKLEGFRYAHRGLHGPGVPENSLAAFRRAAEAGYGAELDVHLTRDGRLVVIARRGFGADVRRSRPGGGKNRGGASRSPAGRLRGTHPSSGGGAPPVRRTGAAGGGAERRPTGKRRRGAGPGYGGLPGPLLHRLLCGEL